MGLPAKLEALSGHDITDCGGMEARKLQAHDIAN
jgi:hypothetical protein